MSVKKQGKTKKISIDLSDLNTEQRAAVTHEKGPLLLIAGAGTGKTTVIANKILWLIQERGIRPDNILALTFTEKTAKEMEERVDRLLPMGLSRVRIATFHGFCERLLRDYAIEIGLDPSFKILTVPEQWLLLRRHLFELPLNYYRPLGNPTSFIKDIVRAIGASKDQDLMPERYISYAGVLRESAETENDEKKKAGLLESAVRWNEFGEVYRAYQQIVLQEGAMDFGDIILNAVRLLEERPSVAMRLRETLEEVLVDEFQDTNGAQNTLLRLLVPDKNGQITVVGDDDQSIYAWRGSNIANILTFQEWYPGAKKIVLTKNYRSPQTLLDSAYKLIQFNNPMRLEKTANVDKRLQSATGEQNSLSVSHHHFPTIEDECAFIADQIIYGVEKMNRSLSDFTILLRANAQSDIIVPALIQRDILFHVSDARGLLLRPEVRDVIAYLRVVFNPRDNVSIFRLISHPIYNLAPYERQRLFNDSRQENFDLTEKLRTASKQPEYSEETKTGLKKFIDLLDQHVASAPSAQPSRIALEYLQKSGYLEWAIKNSEQTPEILPNISEFVQFIKEYERSDQEASLLSFLDYLELVVSSGESPAQASLSGDFEAVKIQTVHSAKGLEFPVVFILGATKDKYPGANRSNPLEIPNYFSDSQGIDEREAHTMEERRLFYVAMTRAKERLFITSASQSLTGKSIKKPSLFIEEAEIETVAGKGTTIAQQLKLPISLEKKATKNSISLTIPKTTSVSQIENYEKCPLQYKFQYIYRIPVLQGHAMTFGNTIHKILKEVAQKVTAGQTLEIADALSLYKKHWNSDGFEDRQHEEERKEKGKIILTAYLEANPYLLNTKPLYAEESFRLRIDDVIVNGRIDRVDKIDGLITVTDFKTGKVKDQKDADKSLQLSVYAIALKDAFDIKAERLVLSYLEGPTDRRTTRTDAVLKKTRKRLMETVNKIVAQDFTPKPEKMTCHFCAFNKICDFSLE
ncbi:MAG: UvrD-helicase domain-containing protein [bacterium]|nr:UvrD-helicase domain-containing protein [bacterium]